MSALLWPIAGTGVAGVVMVAVAGRYRLWAAVVAGALIAAGAAAQLYLRLTYGPSWPVSIAALLFYAAVVGGLSRHAARRRQDRHRATE